MDKKAFQSAKHKAAQARKKLEAMKATGNHADFAQLWSEFLTESHRAFNRLGVATKKGRGNAWFYKAIEPRHSDDLLRYALQARNHEEHGLDITESDPGGFDDEETKKTVFVLLGGPNIVDFVPAEKMGRRAYRAPRLKLLTATDRHDNQYPPPKMHIGKEIRGEATPIFVASATQEYLEKIIAEAEAKFL